MDNKIFHPFEDRLSRDIRNGLSSAFVKAIENDSKGQFELTAATFLNSHPDSCYSRYITDRLMRYNKAHQTILSGPSIPLWQGFVLWDLQLFFEVHEILEHAWYSAVETEKSVLQAVIRAAGVYVKLEFGYTTQAAKMAAKALVVIEAEEPFLTPYCRTDLLITALKELNPTPPKILRSSIYS